MDLQSDERMRTELSLIASLADAPTWITYAAGRLRPADFLLPVHSKAFEIILAKAEAGKPVGDTTLLVDYLTEKGLVGTDGNQIDPQVLREQILECLPTNVPEYCERIVRWSVGQQQLALARKMVEMAHNPEVDKLDALEVVRLEMEKLQNRVSVVSMDLVAANRQHIANLRVEMSNDRPRGMPSGLAPIDELIGGLVPGELIVIGARPANGKTALLMQLLRNAASLKVPRASLMFSMEMDPDELAQRVLCSDAGLSTKAFRSGQATMASVDMLEAVVEGKNNENKHIHIVFDKDLTVSQIRSAVATAVQDHRIGLVGIDYLGMIRHAGTGGYREDPIKPTVIALRRIAKEFHIPIVLLAQLNRDADDPASLPQMRNLAGSAEIERNADIILLLHNPGTGKLNGVGKGRRSYEAGTTTIKPKLIVAKARQASAGVINLRWESSKMRFVEDVQQDDEEEIVEDDGVAEIPF